MEKFIFRQEVIKFLKNRDNQGKQYTAIEIADKIAEIYPEQRKEKLNNAHNANISTIEDVNKQWAREIGANLVYLKEKGILVTSERPRKYFYRVEKDDDLSQDEEISKERKHNQPEKKLYQVVIDFCSSIGIKTMRIDEKKSKKISKNFNAWLHPDIVGFQFVGDFFNEVVKECLNTFPEKSVFYSFEVKDGKLSLGNLRESFFQTVSNSSWANYSYLVAEGIDYDDDRVFAELKLLCESFKIGFIELNKDDPSESKIIIQAPKKQVDWNMINRIIVGTENEDFIQYIKNITIEQKLPMDTRWDNPTTY